MAFHNNGFKKRQPCALCSAEFDTGAVPVTAPRQPQAAEGERAFRIEARSRSVAAISAAKVSGSRTTP